LHDNHVLVSAWLAEYPTCSVRVIADGTGIAVSTVHTTLHELGYRKFVSRWVPHKLSERQKALRVTKSQDLLAYLKNIARSRLHSIITADEAWFYLSNSRVGQWAQS
jgi:DNA-binding MarR family transcriptional regulator